MKRAFYYIILSSCILLVKPTFSQSWHTYFGDTLMASDISVEGIYVDDTSFIIGGCFQSIGENPIRDIAKWHNYSWSTFNHDQEHGCGPTCINY